MPAIAQVTFGERRVFTRILYAVIVIGFVLLAGAAEFHYIEKLDWLDSFYYATLTLTTIGGITPANNLTKIFMIFYSLIGVATVLFLMTNIVRYYIENRESKFEGRLTRLSGVPLHRVARRMRIPHPPTSRLR